MGEEKVIKKIKNGSGSKPMPEFNAGELNVISQLLDNATIKGSDAKMIVEMQEKINTMIEMVSNGQMVMRDGMSPMGANV